MNTTDDLTRTLREQADHIGGHPIDLDTVRGRARTIQRRRRVGAATVAAAVLAVVVPVGINLTGGLNDAAPQPAPPAEPTIEPAPQQKDGSFLLDIEKAPQGAIPQVTYIVIDDNRLSTPEGSFELLLLNKPLVAAGELWRLVTVTLTHAPIQVMPLHLLFNMYFLYLAGPFVERLYGRWTFLLMYVVFAIGASLTSFALTSPPDSPLAVGASGAIFGLFGLLVAAERLHRPVLDRQSRAFLGQLGGLVIFNLILGFIIPGVDNFAHIGGLVTGLVIGLLFAPTRVPTLHSLWVRPGPAPGTQVPAFGSGGNRALKGGGLLLVAIAFYVLWIVGVGNWG